MASHEGLPTIHELVQRWLSLDKNDVTRQEISQLYEQQEWSTLEDRLRNPIQFGTAGLRASMAAGFSRMNNLTVTQASQGLCTYVAENIPEARKRGVVIGYDHRHHSRTFAECTATAFLTKGFQVYLHDRLVHTPLVPFAVRHLHAACGVMITASHNPKADNGYKVYWENACQIIAPHDKGISQAIAANQEPWQEPFTGEELAQHPQCTKITERIVLAYFEAVRSLVSHPNDNRKTNLRFVYTPMHGVGQPFARQALETFGLPMFVPVPAQAEPDPDFPTVKFPNPEEKGALDLAIRTAEEQGLSLVLANDPDADRFALAEKQSNGRWVVFTGDQIGVMLGHYVTTNQRGSRPLAVLNSAVSSRMLAAMAREEGVHYEETLTGFKWLGNQALALSNQGYDAVFAYEEALGYMMTHIVPDKDGITAMVLMAELCCQLHAKGQTVAQHMDSLYDRYGYFFSANSYVICNNAKKIQKAFANIRYGDQGQTSTSEDRYTFTRKDGPTLRYPRQLGEAKVTFIRDLTEGFECGNLVERSSTDVTQDNVPSLPVSSSSEMITFGLDNQCVLTLRTSGTEPKIKYYLEGSGKERSAVQQQVKAIAACIPVDLLNLNL
ncbi:hypothetical protein IWQ62_004361 [Dispira parvispora]|uniref:Phosphoglucomutase n=1 Tax=Dispira parvispora TaxID=1520584 RepID=A0A9W8AT17_9FUNG|nr:hypothetical protein IWQ62_004361 [Dispira parvispora]